MARTAGSNGPKTSQAIRKAGLRLIYQHGYEAMSLRQLAAEVGLQVGSLYNHIHNKQELLLSLLEEHMQQVLHETDAVLAGIEDPVEKLKAFSRFHVAYHLNRKKEVFIANFELRSLEKKNHDTIVALRKEYEDRLLAILHEGRRKKAFRLSDPKVTAYAIIALLTGVCTWYRQGGRLSKEDIIDLHQKLVLDAVR
jgi:AcrR family transcriptional regulator